MTAGASPLAGFADRLRWREDASPAPDALAPALAAFHATSSGPWRAACSLWGQIYFNTLLIPATSLLAAGWRDDAFALSLAPAFCPSTGAPLWFAVHGERRPAAGPQAALALVELVESQLERTIGELAAAGPLPRRMLEEGAELTLRWAAAQIPEGAERLQGLARRDGSRLARGWASGEGAAARRRYCCLRHQLAGWVRCAGICPRREG